MTSWLKDAGALTVLGVTGLGAAVALVVVVYVLIAVTSLWMGTDRRAVALSVLDRLLLLMTVLRGGHVQPATSGDGDAT